MSAIRKGVQRQLFQSDDERLHAIVHVVRVDGRKKKRPTFFCLAVTVEHPISVRLYFVKGEKDDTFKKRSRFFLRDVKEVDGINPKKVSNKISLFPRLFIYLLGHFRICNKGITCRSVDHRVGRVGASSVSIRPCRVPKCSNGSLVEGHEERPIVRSGLSRRNPTNALVGGGGVLEFSWHSRGGGGGGGASWSSLGIPRNAVGDGSHPAGVC
ncbi:unnamed protein product [Heligmosomoides polygyrus]|uniref:Sec3-PIP2_bind domain-containing protein n=1 Tax=Heligmosomoides polygyrus TaxID=6339 RepID=A0A183GD91_HELPZ|nr:unnamed protein product [Heligmosomoides polygyrus]